MPQSHHLVVHLLANVCGSQPSDDDIDRRQSFVLFQFEFDHRPGGIVRILKHEDQAVLGIVQPDQRPDMAGQIVIVTFERHDHGGQWSVIVELFPGGFCHRPGKLD